DRHRHPLDAAGGARLAAHRDVPSRLSRRGGRYREDVHQPRRQAHPGLHHRPLRLSVLPRITRTRKGQTMGKHTVTSFDEDLDHIQRLIRDMDDLAGTMVGASIRALLASDNALAQRVVSDDAIMDARQRELDDRAITLIAKRQPMAQDLRAVVGAIRMAADLERIGDLAKNIAKRVNAVGEGSAPRGLSHSIDTMSQLVMDQVGSVISAYEARDAQNLVSLREDDEKIDVQYTAVFRELLTYMMEDPRNITACTHLLFCAKNLEGIGDHVTNIAENAYYVLTGSQLPVQRPKLDETQMTVET